MSPDRVAAWLTPCCGACKRNKSIKKRGTGVNSTPFVRQYGILLTNGVLLYAKREAKQEIHRGV